MEALMRFSVLILAVLVALAWPAPMLAQNSVNGGSGDCPGATVAQGDTNIGCRGDLVAPATDLRGFGDRYNRHWHTYDGTTLTNRTGGGLVAGDVVALSTANDSSVVAANTQGSRRAFVVAMGTIADVTAGEFARSGIVVAKAQG